METTNVLHLFFIWNMFSFTPTLSVSWNDYVNRKNTKLILPILPIFLNIQDNNCIKNSFNFLWY